MDELQQEVQDCIDDLERMKQRREQSLDANGYTRDAMLVFMRKVQARIA